LGYIYAYVKLYADLPGRHTLVMGGWLDTGDLLQGEMLKHYRNCSQIKTNHFDTNRKPAFQSIMCVLKKKSITITMSKQRAYLHINELNKLYSSQCTLQYNFLKLIMDLM